jgi:hypothetical protein
MNTTEFAHNVKSLGFRVFLAKDGHFGIITDDVGTRVMSFSFRDGSSLSGNYGPPSQKSGTGWRLEGSPSDLVTAEDVRRALYAGAPNWCGDGWKRYTTLAQHLATYGACCGYQEI